MGRGVISKSSVELFCDREASALLTTAIGTEKVAGAHGIGLLDLRLTSFFSHSDSWYSQWVSQILTLTLSLNAGSGN